ncbi:hypothetical protein GCM10022248_52070 [Nonomuraea soli]
MVSGGHSGAVHAGAASAGAAVTQSPASTIAAAVERWEIVRFMGLNGSASNVSAHTAKG